MSNELLWIIIICSFVLLTLLVTLIIFFFKRKRNLCTRNEFSVLLEALGGPSNISNILLKGSRVCMNYDNKEIINKELIKDSGVETIVFANKKITLVIGENANTIYEYLQQNKKEA